MSSSDDQQSVQSVVGPAPVDRWIVGGEGRSRDVELPSLLDPVEIVTGDAVLLDMRPASAASRAAAILIDFTVFAATSFFMAWLAGSWLRVDAQVAKVMALLAAPVVYCLVPIAIESATQGQSLGKLLLGLRVVRDDAGPIRWRHSVVRWLAGVIELFGTSGALAFFVSIANVQGKRLGDMLAGTMVIGDRSRDMVSWQPSMPDGLAPWASTADLDRIPHVQESAMRSLLSRGDQVTPATWDRVAAPLFGEVMKHVSPPPPAGRDGRDVLMAILAERFRRDGHRLQRRQELAASLQHRVRSVPFAKPRT